MDARAVLQRFHRQHRQVWLKSVCMIASDPGTSERFHRTTFPPTNRLETATKRVILGTSRAGLHLDEVEVLTTARDQVHFSTTRAKTPREDTMSSAAQELFCNAFARAPQGHPVVGHRYGLLSAALQRRRDHSVPNLGQTGLLAAQLAQVVELAAADLGPLDPLDLEDRRCVHGKDPLDAHSVRDLTHGDCRAGAIPVAGNDDALEDLNALLGALLDLHMHLDLVTLAITKGLGTLLRLGVDLVNDSAHLSPPLGPLGALAGQNTNGFGHMQSEMTSGLRARTSLLLPATLLVQFFDKPTDLSRQSTPVFEPLWTENPGFFHRLA